jgi:hypothetical protein
VAPPWRHARTAILDGKSTRRSPGSGAAAFRMGVPMPAQGERR